MFRNDPIGYKSRPESCAVCEIRMACAENFRRTGGDLKSCVYSDMPIEVPKIAGGL